MPQRPLTQPGFSLGQGLEYGMRATNRRRETGFEEPLPGQIVMTARQSHQKRYKTPIDEHQPPFLVRTIRVNAHRLKGKTHGASPKKSHSPSLQIVVEYHWRERSGRSARCAFIASYDNVPNNL